MGSRETGLSHSRFELRRMSDDLRAIKNADHGAEGPRRSLASHLLPRIRAVQDSGTELDDEERAARKLGPRASDRVNSCGTAVRLPFDNALSQLRPLEGHLIPLPDATLCNAHAA